MRLQTIVPDKVYSDLKNYCKENSFSVGEFIRHIIRMEIYYKKPIENEIKKQIKSAYKQEKDILL